MTNCMWEIQHTWRVSSGDTAEGKTPSDTGSGDCTWTGVGDFDDDGDKKQSRGLDRDAFE